MKYECQLCYVDLLQGEFPRRIKGIAWVNRPKRCHRTQLPCLGVPLVEARRECARFAGQVRPGDETSAPREQLWSTPRSPVWNISLYTPKTFPYHYDDAVVASDLSAFIAKENQKSKPKLQRENILFTHTEANKHSTDNFFSGLHKKKLHLDVCVTHLEVQTVIACALQFP